MIVNIRMYKSGFNTIPYHKPTAKLHVSMRKAAFELTHLRVVRYLIANQVQWDLVLSDKVGTHSPMSWPDKSVDFLLLGRIGSISSFIDSIE